MGLAMALARAPAWQGRVRVIDARTSLANDRTWCFWRDPDLDLDAMVSRHWQRCSLRHAQQQVVVDCGAQPYQMITALDYHHHARAQIAPHRHIGLQAGQRVLAVDALPAQRGWRIDTSGGAFTAREVVDTRPPDDAMTRKPALWQCFLGAEIECAGLDLPADTALLMDFLPPQAQDGIWFQYVLPLAADRALVEITTFSPERPDSAQLEVLLEHAVTAAAGGKAVRILRREQGALPMGLPQGSGTRPDGVVRAGLFHGAARSSTGYAFQRIQRWAKACARQLAEGGRPLPMAPDAPWLRFMDALFLKVLRADPQRAPALFLQLFARAPTDALLRFLGKGDRLQDAVTVARSLPAAPFLRQLASWAA